VLTAAHAAPMEGRGATITINGNGYGVERVFLHPGYRRMPEMRWARKRWQPGARRKSTRSWQHRMTLH
jgi:hypothetical protein